MYIPNDFKKVNKFVHTVCVKPRDLYKRFGGCKTPNGNFSGDIESAEVIDIGLSKVQQMERVLELDAEYQRTEANQRRLEELEKARQAQDTADE